jgi:hypothetical protein
LLGRERSVCEELVSTSVPHFKPAEFGLVITIYVFSSADKTYLEVIHPQDMAHTMITITRGGSPILYLDSGTSSTNALTLSTGSVWIPAQQFVPTTSGAANTFVALSITGMYSQIQVVDSFYPFIYDIVSK